MRPAALFAPLLVLSLALASGQPLTAAEPAAETERISHRLEIRLEPGSHHLAVVDEITLPKDLGDAPLEFLLNAALTVTAAEPAVEPVPIGNVADFFSLNAATESAREIGLARYRVTKPSPGRTLRLVYEGTVDFGLSDQSEEYTRGFRDTAGIVGNEGVYLAGNGFWYPTFDDELIEFDLEIEMPADWHVISQGAGGSGDEAGRAQWSSGGPMDEIYLVGGPLTVYRETVGTVEALVYLRSEDPALAAKYLEATAQYIEMYRQLLGPYPYGKFALVENFWETGYGMPSFTLLGPRVIRFPFILHSSYPHEILHNWWGNSVFVDYESGNWSEGLTAYLADHLIKEQRGQGEQYRRESLQKYRNYVRDERDFPLSAFRSRHSAATEAVGYGKTLMVFHMLRREVGDEAFQRGLASLYRGFRGERASFTDLRATFESVADIDLGTFFRQWVERPGAPALGLELEGAETDGRSHISGVLTQTQADEPFEVEVPVRVQTPTGSFTHDIPLQGRKTPFSIQTGEPILALQVDPQFDVFRLLDPKETPSSIGQIFGSEEILAVLPATASETRIEAYRALMEGWRNNSHSIRIVLDNEIETLPLDRSTWLLGGENSFADFFTAEPQTGLRLDGKTLSLDGEEVELANHSVVVVRRHPLVDELAIGWLVVEPEAAFPGMGRKLPHYGKYSYLAFEGNEPTNVIKGQWSTSESPLYVDLRPEDERQTALGPMPFEERQPLAELSPVFSAKTLMAHVDFLSSEELEGRGLGSAGARKAAEHIAKEFEAIGLLPGGDDGSYFQTLTVESGPQGEPVEGRNVIGYLAGANSEWADQSVIVGAHYDHLGRGWPDVHQGDEGRIHPGADDNASGVAVMLELARNLAQAEAPQRNLVFVAFTGEEANRVGSKYFVAQPAPFPLSSIRAVVNLDTVGRLFDGKVSVLGTGTADEWQHIFRGASYVTGVESRNVPGSAEASDQLSFIEQGIPGVQIFTSAHEDYHRPGDTADKIDGPGLVKIATLVKEAMVYLGGREEPLTVRISEAQSDQPAKKRPAGPPSGRRVRLGTVPDFTFPGPGVRVDSVPDGSPAAKAGIQAGDILLALAGQKLADLRGYSDVLKTLEPGQTVTAVVLRDGGEIKLEVTLEAR